MKKKMEKSGKFVSQKTWKHEYVERAGLKYIPSIVDRLPFYAKFSHLSNEMCFIDNF